jgi:hypothetical protein
MDIRGRKMLVTRRRSERLRLEVRAYGETRIIQWTQSLAYTDS